MPQAMEPCQAHPTSVLAGDPRTPSPELRQHLQAGMTVTPAAERTLGLSSDWCPICEGQSLAHAPRRAATGMVGPAQHGAHRRGGAPHGGIGQGQ